MVSYVVITGGVVSSVGKGIFSASLGCLFKSRGLQVTIQKLDPYINVDAGTMNPYQHGEVFVTEDGAETDLDLGHYERFIDENLARENNCTMGKIYGAVVERERRGDYLGDTVRVIPHVTDEIKGQIRNVASDGESHRIVIIEIGGTVGDIESLPFLEAIRQLKKDVGPGRAVYLHVTLVPHLVPSGELKTKPTQHSVRDLRSIGLVPDFIIARTSVPLSTSMIEKIALYCDVEPDHVIQNRDLEHIYELPLHLLEQKLDERIMRLLNIPVTPPAMDEWRDWVMELKKEKPVVKVGLVGKYVELRDAYLSIIEAVRHASVKCGVSVNLVRIDAENLLMGPVEEILSTLDGIIVPGGFGGRGIEGKIGAIRYAREGKVPFLGLCYGLQGAILEFARNVCGLEGANSVEVDAHTSCPVIHQLPGQEDIKEKGGTMRVGSYLCEVKEGTKAYAAYGAPLIHERHRHRYEVNNEYIPALTSHGLVVSGVNPGSGLVEIIELADHPWFLACQFHPEFKSRPMKPHPLFVDFLKAVSAAKGIS
ncbi:MAG: CTP synthase [Candidatus Eremiobacteraeota bacterium]|nr:CTP synthase [Candidatus Eremiobacteraeota bacterium]